ncbi:PAQR family membrane homeostasis protein TrhA [Paenibacillus ginsengihumi]|uniref:PAQR family membrane homeostasis protein TrhA n=1 Tax=Paenibacillus ginsengihumi TaxID=431596 RepID=UPI00036FA0F3|nr:hemolysin III family protein [Paenibacillus ginsengihumi]
MEALARNEERWNAISHGFGAACSLAALYLLLERALAEGDPWQTAAFVIFGFALCLLYTSSTLLHSARSPKWIERFELLDHAAIFLLIAGTYTPFMLVTLRGPFGWCLLLFVWAMALSGICYIRTLVRQYIAWTILYYLVMSWLIVLALGPLSERLPEAGFQLLLIGAMMYLIGLVFFLWRRLPYHHAIWHAFVLIGSLCHFWAVYRYVTPVPY